MNHYRVIGTEAECEPNSQGRVLRNILGVTDPEEMEAIAQELLLSLYEEVISEAIEDKTIIFADIREWHRRWLGNVYPWAGKERRVNLSKGGFAFASEHLIPELLSEFDRTILFVHTPCHPESLEGLISSLSIVHIEFILIHPFREGNGRMARLLADSMGMQAGVGPLDYSVWDQDREGYFRAIRSGAVLEPGPFEELFRRALPA